MLSFLNIDTILSDPMLLVGAVLFVLSPFCFLISLFKFIKTKTEPKEVLAIPPDPEISEMAVELAPEPSSEPIQAEPEPPQPDPPVAPPSNIENTATQTVVDEPPQQEDPELAPPVESQEGMKDVNQTLQETLSSVVANPLPPQPSPPDVPEEPETQPPPEQPAPPVSPPEKPAPATPAPPDQEKTVVIPPQFADIQAQIEIAITQIRNMNKKIDDIEQSVDLLQKHGSIQLESDPLIQGPTKPEEFQKKLLKLAEHVIVLEKEVNRLKGTSGGALSASLQTPIKKSSKPPMPL